MFTFSLVIGIVTTVLSWLAKLLTMRMQNNKDIREAELKALNAKATVTKEAREYNNKGFQFTRRFIAVAVTLCVMVAPFAAVMWYQYTYPIDVINNGLMPHIYFGYDVIDKGWWPFTADSTVTKWKEFDGFVITPWHTEMFSWVMGMYFGDRLANHRH